MTHHPSHELLHRFACGELETPTAVLISAHLDACPSCSRQVQALEQGLSDFWLGDSNETAPAQVDVGAVWEKFRGSLEASKPEKSTEPGPIHSLTIHGHRFEVPRSLEKLMRREIKWMPFSNGGQIAKLGSEQGKKLFMIYLPANQSVPHHSHSGKEYSYVISGRFNSDGKSFESGDFAMCDSSVSHAPIAGSDDGCLLVSSIDGRLEFLKGWFRPLNRLLWWALNLKT